MDNGINDATKIIEDMYKIQFEKGYRQAMGEMGAILEKTFRNGYNKGFDDAIKMRCKNEQEKED